MVRFVLNDLRSEVVLRYSIFSCFLNDSKWFQIKQFTFTCSVVKNKWKPIHHNFCTIIGIFSDDLSHIYIIYCSLKLHNKVPHCTNVVVTMVTVQWTQYNIVCIIVLIVLVSVQWTEKIILCIIVLMWSLVFNEPKITTCV